MCPILFVVTIAAPLLSADVQVKEDAEGVTISVDGKLFAKYVINSQAKPILWPIVGPTGKELTRGYPMRKATPDEREDHVHHRSLWFTHGDVNGTSFWHEGNKSGTIRHKEFESVVGGKLGKIVARNEWINESNKIVCTDRRELTFGAETDARWIDFDVEVFAGEEPVKFGDTKEGCFGIRVAGTMKVEAEKGGKIINSHGQTDRDAWGQQAAWVDYHGPVDGEEIVGIAIMNHTSSFRFPTYWHVRTYGLFAANPFGLHNFQNSRDVDGSHTIEPNSSFKLRYRVLLHEGNEQQAQIARRYGEYVGR